MVRCNICFNKLGVPLYEAPSAQSLTSLCELRSGRVRVWLCTSCGHLCGEALENTQDYYESGYRILLDHDDEDQIYEVRADRIVYRTDHQVSTLMSKLNLPLDARLLDLGCAKASTPRRLVALRADLQVHLFDVSAMYIPHWEEFVPESRWAVHDIPADWYGSFDVVTSFFALEHIPEPRDTVSRVAQLLADDGVFYGIVPDTFGNVADFVVIDHVNHFTCSSLHTLLISAGFTDISIDASVHRGALVFTARKFGPVSDQPDVASCLAAGRQLAAYWSGWGDRIRGAEAEHPGVPAAIYGSGFYGSYIATMLCDPGHVQCFLDASPFQQGKTLFGRAILPPQQLPEEVRLLYIGLNPNIARSTMAEVGWLRERNIELVFMDEYTSC